MYYVATWPGRLSEMGPILTLRFYPEPDLFDAFYSWNYGARWTRVAYPILPGARGQTLQTLSPRARSVRVIVSPLCVVLCGSESRIISETSSERSTGRSASLLGLAVCDHPARINPSSVLGVTAERFTRLYISIPFFAFDRERGAELSRRAPWKIIKHPRIRVEHICVHS